MQRKGLYNAILLISIIAVLSSLKSQAQSDSLRNKIAAIAKSIKGYVGVSMLHIGKNDTLTFHGKDHFPMQSVYKYPLALAVMHQVDLGKLKLEQKLHINKKDLLPNTWSPLREKYPEGNVDVALSEIISFTVSQSDNNGCDFLFRLLGGPKAVDQYIHSLGVKDIAIVATEEEMHKEWNVQYRNWCQPIAMTELFNLLFTKKILSKSSTEFLWEKLIETSTGPKRIKGLLPPNIIVGHKTGTGGQNEKGITGAINDAGIIILPNGDAIALTVFVSDTPENDNDTQAVIAKISKAIFDHYATGK